jgi:hypothetical protein
MHTANAKRIAWFIRLQSILRFQKQHFAPRHAALRPQIPTKNDFPARSSGYVALAKLATFSAGYNSILALGSKQSTLVDGPIGSSSMLAAHVRALATKTDVLGTGETRDGPLAALRLIKGLGTERQLLQGPGQPHPVRVVQTSTPVEADRFLAKILEVKHPKFPARPWPINKLANGLTATLRRSTVSNALSLPAVGTARAFRPPSTRYSFVDVGDESSLRARPPPTDEQFGLNGFANQASQIGQESRAGTSGYQPHPCKASSSATMIHIDGSVLGRWAIQHLERALGTPATGMTGVDPRASLPRSRVSPF